MIIASFIGSRVQQLVLLRAPEQLLMVAGSTSNVLAEQCVTRASCDDDGATAGGRPQRALRVGGRSCTAKGTCSVIIAATGAARPFLRVSDTLYIRCDVHRQHWILRLILYRTDPVQPPVN